MSYRTERYAPPPRRSGLRGCLIGLVLAVWLLVLGLVAVRYWIQPRLTAWVEDRVARTLDPSLPGALGGEDALRRSLEQLPSVPLPSGELRVNEDLANAYLADYRASLPLVDDIRVQFAEGEIQATVSVRGLESTASVRPTVRDGRIVVDSAQLGQPLGSLLSIDGMLGALTDRLNADLAAQGKQITGLTVADGVAIVNVE